MDTPPCRPCPSHVLRPRRRLGAPLAALALALLSAPGLRAQTAPPPWPTPAPGLPALAPALPAPPPAAVAPAPPAQAPPPAAAPAPTPAAGTAQAAPLGTLDPAVAAQLPAPPPAAAPAPTKPASLQLSGFLLARIMGATAPASTYGHRNLQATTGAFPRQPGQAGGAGVGGRVAWSVAQSRLGLAWRPGPRLATHLELDFYDAALSEPTTAAKPRLRIASLRLRLSEHTSLLAGQDWDLFSPLAPFTYNFVGLYFQAGNAGFVRHQVRLERQTEQLELAVGLAAAGATAAGPTADEDGQLERGAYPLGEARIAWTPGRHRLGLSGLAGARGYVDGSRLARAPVLGGNLFVELRPAEPLIVRGEANWGRNLADTGALSLSQRRNSQDVDELGGFLSFKLQPCALAVYGGAGAAYILRASRVAPFDGARAASTNAMASNLTAKLGLSVRVGHGLTGFAEYAYFRSKFAGLGAPNGYRSVDTHAPEVGLHWAFGA